MTCRVICENQIVLYVKFAIIEERLQSWFKTLRHPILAEEKFALAKFALAMSY